MNNPSILPVRKAFIKFLGADILFQMQKYTSYFIGIPLPEKHQEKFETLLKELFHINSEFEATYQNTPHITVFYLDKQSQFNLPEIAEQVKSKLTIFKNAEITVEGSGYFVGNNQRVVFLNIAYPDSLREFNGAIAQTLIKFTAADSDLPFHPHMTIGKIRTANTQESEKGALLDLERKINQVHWTFPIEEIALYGVDSTKKPEHQEKIIVFTVK